MKLLAVVGEKKEEETLRELTIVSGKGGTGKTTIAACLIQLAAPVVAADCDVDASNLPILLEHTTEKSAAFYGLQMPVLVEDSCIGCGLCFDACRFDAITLDEENRPIFDHKLCEGCTACAFACPEEAISMTDHVAGHLHISSAQEGPLIHADLTIGEDISGKLVTKVREEAREIAKSKGHSLIIIDGSPGVGCPVISSLTSSDLALAVIEPTLSGLSDFKRLHELSKQLRIPLVACINKFDLSEEMTAKIEQYCATHHIPILAKIPFDTAVSAAMSETKTVLEFAPESPAAQAIRQLWTGIQHYLNEL